MSDVKYMDIAEFRQLGYLQEVNRLFLHPLGLALDVIQDGNTYRLGGIWDERDDPEGIAFAELGDDDGRAKARYVAAQMIIRFDTRKAALGYVVQPIPDA